MSPIDGAPPPATGTPLSPEALAHVAWCKARAHELIATGDIMGAVSGFITDLEQHPECVTVVITQGVNANAIANSGDTAMATAYIDSF